MQKFPILFLLCSLELLSLGCSNEYSHLRALQADEGCPAKGMPWQIETSWYTTSVDIMGKHISGLLLIKNMPDSSQRLVFTNEVGLTFFDFEFSNGSFTVHTVISQLDKRAVVQTLRKDFELILGIPFRDKTLKRLGTDEETYFGVVKKNETAYFITTKDCAYLRRLEWASSRKRKVSVQFPGSTFPSPDKVILKHYTFDMQIELTRILKDQ